MLKLGDVSTSSSSNVNLQPIFALAQPQLAGAACMGGMRQF